MVKRWQMRAYHMLKWAIRSQGSFKEDQGSTTTQSILNNIVYILHGKMGTNGFLCIYT